MIVLRYFFWLAMYHLLTIHKQHPIGFILGLVLLPYYTLDRFFHSPELHKDIVAQGVASLKRNWQLEGAIPPPPKFIQERFEALGRESSA